eukprot:999825_1
MSQVYEETLLPFIHICRTLEVCTSDETIAFDVIIGDTFPIQTHNPLLSECTQIQILFSVYPMLSVDMLNELLLSLPTKDQQTDDSMSLNSTSLDDAPPKLLIQIPKDLLIHAFQYLDVEDIYRIEKTCRLLCVIAHNPNSLWHLSLDLQDAPNLNTFEHYRHYTHPRYAKIKILHFLHHRRGLAGHRMMMKALPQFMHLKTLCLNLNSFDEEYQEHIPKFTISPCLQTLRLADVDSVLVFQIITKCSNLRTLILRDVDMMDDRTWNDTHGMLNQINSCKEYPIPLLNTLIIDKFCSENCTLQLLIYWILANGCKSKTLCVLDHGSIAAEPSLMTDFFNHSVTQNELLQWQQKALMNVSKLVLRWYDFGLVNNISKWINKCKKIRFEEFIMDAVCIGPDGNDVMQPLHNIVSRSSWSSFCWSPRHQYICKDFTDNTYPDWLERCNIEQMNMRKRNYKWIVHDWPIAMLSNDLSCFDSITLSLHTDCTRSSSRFPCSRAEWFMMTAINVFESAIKPWVQLVKSSRFTSNINYNLSVHKCKWFHELDSLKDLCEQENGQGLHLGFECLNGSVNITF